MMTISPLHYIDSTAGFRWQEADLDGPFQLVLLAEDYRHLARIDGIEGSPWRPQGQLAELLQTGTTYHAYLLAHERGRLVRSALTTFVWQ